MKGNHETVGKFSCGSIPSKDYYETRFTCLEMQTAQDALFTIRVVWFYEQVNKEGLEWMREFLMQRELNIMKDKGIGPLVQ